MSANISYVTSIVLAPQLAGFQVDISYWTNFFPRLTCLHLIAAGELESWPENPNIDFRKVMEESQRRQLVAGLKNWLNWGAGSENPGALAVFSQTDANQSLEALISDIKNYETSGADEADHDFKFFFKLLGLWLLFSYKSITADELLNTVKNSETNLWATLRGDDEDDYPRVEDSPVGSFLPQNLADKVWAAWVGLFTANPPKRAALAFSDDQFWPALEILKPKLLATVKPGPNLAPALDFLTSGPLRDFGRTRLKFLEISAPFSGDGPALEVYLLPGDSWRKALTNEGDSSEFWVGPLLKPVVGVE